MKKIKKVFIVILTVVLVAAGTVSFTNAAQTEDFRGSRIFYKAYVDSNTFSNICYSNTYYDTVKRTSVKVVDIFKADGSASSYKKVKAKMIVNTYNSDVQTVNKDTIYYFSVPSEYQTGWQYLLKAMGNNPSLDCQITGTFSIHN